MKLDSATYTIFDFETTGLYPYSGDKICEIGAVRINPSKAGRPKKFHSLVDPERPISYGAFSVNGISEEMLEGAPTINEVMPSFLDFIKDSVLVAYNAGFDLGFFEAALGEDSHKLDDYYVIDALGLARRLFKDQSRYNLKALSQSLGVEAAGAHRAMADALMTLEIFKKELKLLSEEGIGTIDGILFTRKHGKALKKVEDYKIKVIEEAIREEKKLNITYRSRWNDGITKRTIMPRQMQEGYDRSYVVAHCYLKNEERTFRLDGIIDVEVVQ